MSVKSALKRITRHFGLEISRYNPQTSESAQLNKILDFKKIDLVLDVGANTGQYAKSLRQSGYGGRILSFEPLIDAYDTLLIESRDDKDWEVYPRIAIGDFDGEIKVNVSKNRVSSSMLDILETHTSAAPQSEYIGEVGAKIAKLDSILPEMIKGLERNIYLKIDVQGAEKKVLDGASEMLKYIEGIQLELSTIPLYKDQALYEELVGNLRCKGYELFAVFHGFVDKKTGRSLQFDGVFFKR